jgi:transcriptional regulator with PAS, ATPase and Fis domain
VLVRYFLDSFSRSLGKSIKDISPQALDAMRAYA